MWVVTDSEALLLRFVISPSKFIIIIIEQSLVRNVLNRKINHFKQKVSY